MSIPIMLLSFAMLLLCDRMLRSVASDGGDKELQDTGLVLGAIYTVLQVVEVEEYRLGQ